ncbi:hypothetical protein Tco_0149925 [Tanacetum coccineum]
MDSIEKAIAERGLYKRVHYSRVNKGTMQTHEGMINKDASDIDNNVARASHDKDNITEERVRDFNEKQYIKNLEQEKEELQDQVLKIKNATKAFKQDEDKYVNNIIQLEAKNKDLENIVCKMGKSSQTLRMLTNEQSLYRETKRKMGFGYTDPCPLGKAIACHPKLYDAKVLVKMKGKQFQFNYENINSLYDTFVPQTELSPEQECFSNAPISSESESSKEMSDLPVLKMPNEMLNIFESMESKVDRTSKKHEIFQNKIDQLLEANIANDVKNLVMQYYVGIKNKEEIERFSKKSKDSEKFCNDVVEVKEKLSKQIVQHEKDFSKLEAQSIAFEIALQHKNSRK